jgi:LysM repeat protein
MKPALKKTFSAIIIALASLVIVIGIASLAMVQGGTSILPGRGDSTATPTLAIITEASDVGGSDGTGGSGGSTGSSKPTITQVASMGDQTATPPSVLSCETPEGWMPIIVMPDQTLNEIAAQYNTSPEILQEGNCLDGSSIQAGSIIFVPTTAQTSQSSIPCGPPAGWVIYYVQPGDTLYGIATMFGTTVNQLVNANCLNTTYVYSGQRLYVPPYYAYPIQPIIQPTPWITIPDLLTPEVPYLPTGIPFPILPPSP